MLRRIIAINLAKRGYVISEAATVAHSLQHLRDHKAPFDLVLLDIMLPDGSGWEIMRHLRASQHQGVVPVIIMTAVIPEAGKLTSHTRVSVILKPFGIDALLRLIERVMLVPGHDAGVADLAEPSL